MTGRAFPENFYTFLHKYMLSFVINVYTPDQKVLKCVWRGEGVEATYGHGLPPPPPP